MVSMLRTLAAALWSTSSTKDKPANLAIDSSMDDIDCTPWPVPDPHVRLRQVGGVIRIHGFPEHLPYTLPLPEEGGTGPESLYLRCDVPAYCDYVMGHDWRKRLTVQEGEEGEVIMRPTVNQTELTFDLQDEERHCLRMRRCGAIIVESLVHIIQLESGFADIYQQPAQRQLFGWSEDGAVWILRAPPSAVMTTLEQQLEMLNRDPEGLEQQRFEDTRTRLREAKDMPAVCSMLEQAGAQYYERAADCPEVRELKLECMSTIKMLQK